MYQVEVAAVDVDIHMIRAFEKEVDDFSVDFAATSPTARGKKSTFTGKEAHSHGHEVHREQRGFCPSAP